MDIVRPTPDPHPGPTNQDLLHMYQQHRSLAVFRGENVDQALRFRRCDRDVWRWKMHDRVRDYVYMAGFEGVYRTGNIRVDHHLVTALVERWREETHTFHLPVGEATVTLQDVEVLWGLRIDGMPVIGVEPLSNFPWADLCEELLGFRPNNGDIRGCRLRVGAISPTMSQVLLDDAPEEAYLQRARMHILVLLGGILFSDSSSNFISLHLLPMLRDLESLRQYSWGSAVLAYLYRKLCKTCVAGVTQISGPLLLLQIWAWERIPVIRPVRVDAGARPPGPLGARWKTHFDTTRTCQHVVSVYRDQLARLRFDQFVWIPYTDDVLADLPPYCTEGRHIWRSSTPLIYWDIVEWHLPHRVLRQFGFQQPVPTTTDTERCLHTIVRLGCAGRHWHIYHADYLAKWAMRANSVVEGTPCDPLFPDKDYMKWYRQRTVLYTMDPQRTRMDGFHGDAPLTEYLLDGIARIGELSLQALEQSHGDPIPLLTNIRDEAFGVMEYAHQMQRMHCNPSRRQDNVPLELGLPPTKKMRRSQSGGSRRRAQGQSSKAHNTPTIESPMTMHLVSHVPTGEGPLSGHPLDAELVAGSSRQEAYDLSSDYRPPLLLASTPMPPQIPISWPSNWTLSREWVEELMNAFEWASRNLPPQDFPSLLPVEVSDRLILLASEILHKEKNCVSIHEELGSESRVVVVGDLHGQLHDLLFILKDAGYPGKDKFFVFNGDYVDRGAWGLETFLLLLAWKVLLPNRVFLLRGNHESKYCTSVYGFEKEVLFKYGDRGKDVYQKCLECFEGLPLASIIAGHAYTAHGGLFRNITSTPPKRSKGKKRKVIISTDSKSLSLGSFEELSKATRYVLDPPWEGQNLIPGDVLWSDPSMSPGVFPNKERGIGLLWGPDCTEEFLKKFSLKLIIRSREGPDARKRRPGLRGMDEGYAIDHVVDSGKLITVFSAPDYPQFQATEDRCRNKGAYIVLEPPDFDTPVFHSFDAITPRPAVNPYYDYENVIDSDEELDLASMVPAT